MTASLLPYLHDDTLPVVADDLSDLPEDRKQWCVWKVNSALVRRADALRYVAVQPFLFTDAITWGWIAEPLFYEDRWCYDSAELAIVHATVWSGAPFTEPDGWHRHPRSGRRRPGGDSTQEYVNP